MARIGPRRPLGLTSLTALTNGTLQFSIIGLSGAIAVIEKTPTLTPLNWQPISTNTIVNGTVTFTTSRSNQCFFRANVQ